METGWLLQISINGEVKFKMNEQKFLEYANESGRKIREIMRLICGSECMDDGLLCDVFYRIGGMLEIYLSSITGKEIGSDELAGMAVKIMYAGEDEIEELINKVCGSKL